MNNNMNEQTNQETNNAVSTNGTGIFFNNVEQPTNQAMNNNVNMQANQEMINPVPTDAPETYSNNVEQPINQGMNNNLNQPTNQTFMNNGFGGTNNFNQNNVGNMPNPSYVPNNNEKNGNKKIWLFAAIGVAILLVVIVVVVLISLLSKSPESSTGSNLNSNTENSSAKRTLTCTARHAAMGVYYDEIYKYYIDDESMTVYVTEKIDLKKTQLEGDVDGWANDKIDSAKKECNATSGCKFEHKYSKGNYLETTLILSGELINEQIKGLTADEIYGQQKSNLESEYFTCTGNGNDATDSNSVYKTIDFNSYTGDSESTEFDELINKKVTFTNVPTLGGSLGNLLKNISCRNESSFTIEDDSTYTVTGIVTYNNGTFAVGLKDCTLTKN